MSRKALKEEIDQRCSRAQALMLEASERIDVLVVTTEVDVSYFSGLESQFWNSPTRPICLLIPNSEARPIGPIAVVPEIMEIPFRALSSVARVVTWPCIQESIVGIMVRELKSFSDDHQIVRVATPMNAESHVRVPLLHLLEIAENGVEWVDGSSIVHNVRLVKSPHEVHCVRTACQIASSVLHTLPIPSLLTEREFARSVGVALLRDGADSVPFVVVSSGVNGCVSIVSGPTDRRVERGNVLCIDVGCTYAGYWCDFNRNYAIGEASESAKKAHRILWDATECALKSLINNSEQTFGGLWKLMMNYCVLQGGDPDDYKTGRMGHGLGRTLTELPSVTRDEPTILKPGMVLTLEPCLRIQGGLEWMVHEECIVITMDGYSLLTTRAPRELMILTIDAN